MADKGIIFSAPMVQALLAGRKTQTRRLCAWANNPLSPSLTYIVACDEPGWFGDEEGDVQFRAPYTPGDRLYVREAFCVRGVYSDVVEIGYEASRNAGHTEYVEQIPVALAVDQKGNPPKVTFPKNKPCIHMPRWASRLTLNVTDVRVERLQEISEADALAEGIAEERLIIDSHCAGGVHTEVWGKRYFSPHDPTDTEGYEHAGDAFAALWNSLHIKPGETWDANPWVVVPKFKVIRQNIDAAS